MFQLLKSHHQAVKFKDYFTNRYYVWTGLARYGIFRRTCIKFDTEGFQ
jgi:hypothetical protein